MSLNQLKFKSLVYSDSKLLSDVSRPGKALHGRSSGANSDLAAWDEKARAYYNSVMSGETKRPSETQWEEFLNELQWAEGKLWGSRVSEGENSDAGPVADGTQDLPIPEGAVKGALNNNVVWGKAKTNIDFTGDSRTQDILSNDFTLNISSLSATVYTEKTRDTRLQPPTDVIKIIVQDQFTGQLSVYFVHDYKDAHITINTPTGTINQDATGGLVTVGTYSPEGAQDKGASPEANILGEKQADGSIVYDQLPDGVDHAEFFPKGSGKSGEGQTHEVYVDSNITVGGSDHVEIIPGGAEATNSKLKGQLFLPTPKPQGGVSTYDTSYDGKNGYTIVVKHRDGSVDTYKIHKGYKVNINAKQEYVKWGKAPEGTGDSVQFDFNNVTLNGSANGQDPSKSGDSSGNSDTSADTPLPADKKKGDTWHYDGNDLEDVDVTPTFDHKDNVVEIPGTFTLTPTDDQTVTVEKDPSTKHYIITVSAPGKTPVTYDVDPSLTKIDLKIQESKVNFIKHDKDGNGVPDDALLFDGKIQIKGKPVSQSNKAQGNLQHTLAGVDEIKKGIKINGHSYDQLDPVWKADVDWASDAAKDIGAGLEDGNWDALNSDFAAMGIGQDNFNCALRAQMLLSFLRSAFSGPSRDKKIKMVLAQIFSANKDPDLRGMWTDALAKSGNTATAVKSDFSGDWWTDPRDDTYQSSISFIKAIDTGAE